MRGAKQWLGLGLLVIAVLAVVGYEVVARAQQSSNVPVTTVHGLVGGEKLGFLQDPDIQRILRDRYHLAVDPTKAGSIEMVQGDTSGQDFLWPSSQVALDLYKQRHGAATKTTTTFSSPIVLYAWAPVATALTRAGLVHSINGVLYVTDFPRLVRMVIQGKPWSSLGLPQLYGPVTIFTTDPNKSNSGVLFSGLLANTLNGNQVTDESTLPRVLPNVKLFYNRLGFLESSSSDLFDQFLKTGIGAKPMIVGYENQLVEYGVQNPSYVDLLRKNIRVLYPRPTVWSEHSFIAQDSNGVKLLNALNDSDIQRLAWTQHGFRTGVVGTQNNPNDLKVIGVSRDVPAIMPMPRFQVVNRILQALSR